MTASHTSVLLPSAAEFYRPSAAPVLVQFVRPALTEIPPDVHITTILSDLAVDNVSVPSGTDPTALVAIAADARDHGIPLSIVLIRGNPSPEADLRDIATEVGKHQSGTIVVLSDDEAGTFSDSISRVRLEAAEDVAKNRSVGHSTEAARAFVDSLEHQPAVSPTAVTCVLVVGTALVAAALYALKQRRRTAAPEPARVS